MHRNSTSRTFLIGLETAFAANTARIGFSSFTTGAGDLLTSSNCGEDIVFCAIGDFDDRRDLAGVEESMISTTSAARFFPPTGLLSTAEACFVVFRRFLNEVTGEYTISNASEHD